MPSSPENVLMKKFSINYAEARRVAGHGRKSLQMGRFDAWTPELDEECERIFSQGYASKEVDTSDRSTEETVISEMSTLELNRAEEDEDIDLSIEEVFQPETKRTFSDTTMTTTATYQDSTSSLNSSIQSFLVDLLGHRLPDCEMIVDNALCPADRAVDFDLIKSQAELNFNDSMNCRWQTTEVPAPVQQVSSPRAPGRQPSLTLEDRKAVAVVRRKVDPPKPPQRHLSDEGEILAIRMYRKAPVKQRRTNRPRWPSAAPSAP